MAYGGDSERGYEAKFFGLGLVVPGHALVLGLMQRWPPSHEGWPRGVVVNHENSVISVYELSCDVNCLFTY